MRVWLQKKKKSWKCELLDTIGLPLEEAVWLLQQANLAYRIEWTYPTRNFFPVDRNFTYVIRQRLGEDGAVELTIVAKMRKEV